MSLARGESDSGHGRSSKKKAAKKKAAKKTTKRKTAKRSSDSTRKKAARKKSAKKKPAASAAEPMKADQYVYIHKETLEMFIRTEGGIHPVTEDGYLMIGVLPVDMQSRSNVIQSMIVNAMMVVELKHENELTNFSIDTDGYQLCCVPNGVLSIPKSAAGTVQNWITSAYGAGCVQARVDAERDTQRRVKSAENEGREEGILKVVETAVQAALGVSNEL